VKNPEKLKLITASAVAPPIAAAFIALIVLWLTNPSVFLVQRGTEITGYETTPLSFVGILLQHVKIALLGAGLGTIIGWPAMLLGGLPLHGLLIRARQFEWKAYVLAGVAAGTIAMIVYVGATSEFSSANKSMIAPHLAIWLAGPLTGGLAAYLFWRIRRPDKSSLIVNRRSRVGQF
jgi:hypothetical protein